MKVCKGKKKQETVVFLQQGDVYQYKDGSTFTYMLGLIVKAGWAQINLNNGDIVPLSMQPTTETVEILRNACLHLNG